VAELAILVPVYQREEGAIRAVRSVVSQAHQELSQGSLTLHVRDDAFEKHGFRAIQGSVTVHPSLYFYRFQCRESRHVGEYPFHGS